MDAEQFKAAVKGYLDTGDEISRHQQRVREFAVKKEALGSRILAWMQRNNVDELELPDGKLIRSQSKRTESLKKEHILRELLTLMSEARAEQVVLEMYARRDTSVKHALSRKSF